MAPDPAITTRLQRALGRRLREARRSKGKGQKELGAALRLTRTSVSNLERGKQRVYLDQVYEAAKFLDIQVSELLPAMEDVFPAAALHEPGDDPLTARGKAVALRITAKWAHSPATTRTRKRK